MNDQEARYKNGVMWLRKAAQTNAKRKTPHQRASSLLGYCYENGMYCRENLNTAVTMYQRAAAQGDAFAMYRIGCMMIHGDGRGGIRVDENEGLEWLRKAAQQRTLWGDNGGRLAVQELQKLNQWDGN